MSEPQQERPEQLDLAPKPKLRTRTCPNDKIEDYGDLIRIVRCEDCRHKLEKGKGKKAQNQSFQAVEKTGLRKFSWGPKGTNSRRNPLAPTDGLPDSYEQARKEIEEARALGLVHLAKWLVEQGKLNGELASRWERAEKNIGCLYPKNESARPTAVL